MAGSKKYFAYQTDSGDVFAVLADESNTEAVNGSTNDLLANATVKYWIPKNLKTRRAIYANSDGTRQISCVCLTQTIYNGVQSAVPSITDPIAGTGTLNLIRLEPERIRLLPVGEDSGLNDGDAT